MIRHILLLITASCLPALATSATAQESYSAATAPARADQVWVPGQWIWTGSAYEWRPGAWCSAPQPLANARPATVWIEGRWIQGPDGWVWNPAHFEAAPTDASALPAPEPHETVVYRSAPETVVYDQAPTTVVVGEPLCPPPVVYRERTVCEPQRPHGNVDISVGVALAGHGGPAPHVHPFVPLLPPLPPLRLLDPLFFLHHHH